MSRQRRSPLAPTTGTYDARGRELINFGHVVVNPRARRTLDVAARASAQTIVAGGGSDRLVIVGAGAVDLSGVNRIPTVVPADNRLARGRL